MAALYEESNMNGLALLREMSYYFAGFLPRSGNHYIELISHLKDRRKPFTLATTNYDLLIEFVINTVGSKFNYVPSDSPDQIAIYKIHGSCNFLPSTRGMRITGATYILAPGARIMEGPIQIGAPDQIREFCTSQDSLAPAIAMYSVGKELLLCSEQVLEQRRQWQKLAKAATVNYVVGLKVEKADAHIWDILAESPADLVYVGMEKDLEDWKVDVGKRNAYWIGERLEDALEPIKTRLT